MSDGGPIACELICQSISPHVQQIYTGYRMLADRGAVRLRQTTVTPRQHANLPGARDGVAPSHLRVVLNGRRTLLYDLQDDWRIDEDAARAVDVYFKRSLSIERLQRAGLWRDNLRPLGLNYPVFPDRRDWLALQRLGVAASAKEKLLQLLHTVWPASPVFPTVRSLEAPPAPELPPRVLFVAKAWDPGKASDDARASQRSDINRMRAECVRSLRDTLGDRFVGGLMRTAYARRSFADCLVPEGFETRRHRYLQLARTIPVGVATTGLHDSIGWKLAEYVALSRAIVSEKPCYEVPGGFSSNEHYLPFTTPEECAKQAARLLADARLRARLMRNNARYYASHLRPDVLVMRSIAEALAATAVTR